MQPMVFYFNMFCSIISGSETWITLPYVQTTTRGKHLWTHIRCLSCRLGILKLGMCLMIYDSVWYYLQNPNLTDNKKLVLDARKRIDFNPYQRGQPHRSVEDVTKLGTTVGVVRTLQWLQSTLAKPSLTNFAASVACATKLGTTNKHAQPLIQNEYRYVELKRYK